MEPLATPLTTRRGGKHPPTRPNGSGQQGLEPWTDGSWVRRAPARNDSDPPVSCGVR